MAFLEKLGGIARTAGEKAAEVAKTAGEKAGTAIEVGKLSVKVKSEENEIDNIKLALGQLIWEQYLAGNQLGEDLAQLCREIQNHQNIISGLKDQIVALKEKPEENQPEVKPETEKPEEGTACREDQTPPAGDSK